MKQKAFTTIELLVVIAISAVIAVASFSAFIGLYNFQALDKDTDVILSYIEKARIQAINSKNFSEFGVAFASTSVTLFEGKVLSGSGDATYNFSSKVIMSEELLSTTTHQIYFNKISGEPSATGTITFRLKSNASTTKRIIIYNTGLSEIQ